MIVNVTDVVLLVVLVGLVVFGAFALLRRVLPDVRAHRATDFDTVVAEHIDRKPIDASRRDAD